MHCNNDALHLDHCHHCGIDDPDMTLDSSFVTNNHRRDAPRNWQIYHCQSCGGAILTGSITGSGVISEMYPSAINTSAQGQPARQSRLSPRATRGNTMETDLPAAHFL